MKKSVIICFIIIAFYNSSLAQAVSPVRQADTVKFFEILRGNSLREVTTDSGTKLQTIAGNVLIRQGGTLFSCDSAIINSKYNTIEAFNHIDINQGDTLHAYSQYLKYFATEKLADLKNKVSLTDKKGTLYTDELLYDLKTGIGTYDKGGKVINGTTTLTSTKGTYYSDTKDILFKYNVHLVDPKYKINADSLLYNTQTQIATFIGPTHIIGKTFDAITTSGYYNLQTGEALFDKRSHFKDSTTNFVADHIAFDEKTGVAQLEGNAVVKDSSKGYIVTGNQIYLNQKNNTFLATRKPVLILIQDKDSTYIAADTLFSGIRKKPENNKIDTLSSAIDSSQKITSIDTLVRNSGQDSLKNSHPISGQKVIRLMNTPSDSIRYFIGFHHVRIFNDSLQSVSDSLYYSTEDSVFRLFQKPVVWSSGSQITGDTMYLFTRNKKPDRLYVFNNSAIINKSKSPYYNQIAGKNLNGYFKKGELDYMRVKGSPAESIYYMQDKDSAYVGMNRASSDVIEIYFEKSELKKIKFLNDVHGVLHPIRHIPDDKMYLKNFMWLDKSRPKNKLELFE